MNSQEDIHEWLNELACMSADEIKLKFRLSLRGYSQFEAAKQRAKYGCNEPMVKNKDSIAHCIFRAFINPFSVILFSLGLISFMTDVLLSNDYHKNFTAVVIIFVMLIISGVVRFLQEVRAKRVTDELIRLVHTTVKVRRDNEWKEISSSELVVGDQIQVEAGDRVPADLRLIYAQDLFVSQSVITGESGVIEKTTQALTDIPEKFADYRNILFSGTTVTGGKGMGVVVSVGRKTVYGGFSSLSSNRAHSFEQGANSIAHVLIRFMMILVPVVFIASGLTKNDWVEAFLFALSVAVGLTPEMLPMVVNACLAKGSHSMAVKQTIVKNINAMQGFGSMDILCIDKTGTLTGDRILLEYYMDILGNESHKVLDYGYLASYYHTGVQNHLDEAICKADKMPGKKQYYNQLTEKYPKVDEMPFDYERGFSSVLLNGGNKNILIIKGNIDEVVKHCGFIEYRGKITDIGDERISSVYSVVNDMLEDGMKVIAVAYKDTLKNVMNEEDLCDFILLGYLAFFDAPKKSAASAIKKLHDLHVNIKVLTGDQKDIALSVCRRLDITEDVCITGSQLDQLTENELQVIIEKHRIFAELSPGQKAMIVEILQTNGHTVGFLGDGTNDLPAVVRADVGISVENAAEAVKDSASVILLKKDLNVLEAGILEGRKAFANMTKYIKITASSNFGNICAVVVASIFLPFFPMTSVQLLLLNLLYDILCLILPWDNVDEDVLKRPLEWSGKKLGKFMALFGPLSSVFDIITFVFLYFILCPFVCGGAYSQLDRAGQLSFIAVFQTGWFLESMWSQILILQLLRTKHLPFIRSRSSNSVIFVTAAGILLFSLLPVTHMGTLLKLTALPLVYFIYLVICVVGYLLLVTVAKKIYIKNGNELI